MRLYAKHAKSPEAAREKIGEFLGAADDD